MLASLVRVHKAEVRVLRHQPALNNLSVRAYNNTFATLAKDYPLLKMAIQANVARFEICEQKITIYGSVSIP